MYAVLHVDKLQNVQFKVGKVAKSERLQGISNGSYFATKTNFLEEKWARTKRVGVKIPLEEGSGNRMTRRDAMEGILFN